MRTDRPAFIDPAPVVAGGEIGEARAPRWFVALAILILAIAAGYLASQISGPKLSWRHDFVSGTDVRDAGGTGGSSEPAH